MDLELTAMSVETIAETDYKLARDTLLAVHRRGNELVSRKQFDMLEALDTVIPVEGSLLEELPTEQAADLEARSPDGRTTRTGAMTTSAC